MATHQPEHDGSRTRRRPRRVIAAAIGTTFALSGATAVAPALADELPAPVLHYSFDALTSASAGTAITDDSGNDRAATLHGDGATVVAGPTGLPDDRALQLPGGANTSSAAHAKLPALADAFAGKDDLTMSFWAKWSGSSSCSWIATAGTAQSRHVFSSPSCGSAFLNAVNVDGENRATGGAALSAEWVQITLVLEGGSKLTVYKDGAEAGVSSALASAKVASALFPSGSTFGGYLGKSFYGADPYYEGAIDDFRLYDEALSEAQIAQLSADVDATRVQSAASALDLGETTDLAVGLDLPTIGAHNASITWATSDPTVISASGEIHPQQGAVGRATLTATITLGVATATREFEVTVAAVVPEDAVAGAAERLALPVVLASGTALPTALFNGVAIDWSSPTDGVTVTDGVLTAPSGTVDLHASLSYPGSSATAAKTLRVRTLAGDDAWTLAGYTRTPTADVQNYSSNLANSLHLALGKDAGLSPLNENYGILFARSIPTADENETAIRNLTQPAVFHRTDGGYGVLAVRTLSDGTPDESAATSLLYFTSEDLTHFTQVGAVRLNDAATGVRRPTVHYDSSRGEYVVFWTNAAGGAYYSTVGDFTDPTSVSAPAAGPATADLGLPELAIPGATPWSSLVVDAAQAEVLRNRFGRITNTTVEVEDVEVPVGEDLDLSDVEATLGYTDGSTAELPIDWSAEDLAAVDTSVPGEYTVLGTVRQRSYPYPFIENGADPHILQYEDGYLYVATRNEYNDPGIWIRQASTIDGLRTAEEQKIVTPLAAGNLRPPFWAPELHVIDGRLTVIFASNPLPDPGWTVQVYLMQLKPGGRPDVPADWDAPVNMTQADGSAITPGISLDMTYFEDTYQGKVRSYVMWSGRIDWKDARLYIATIDPSDPFTLTSDPILVKENEYGWNKNQAPVDEGPFMIRHGDTLNVTFSGSAVDHTYAIGRLTATSGSDLLDPDSWAVDNYPLLKADWTRTPLELGPGHNSFTVDEDGNDLLVFHARDELPTSSPRDTNLRRVHWAADGYPILDMTADEEVLPENRAVAVTVTVATSAGIEITTSTTARCVAGKTVLVATVTNTEAVPLDLEVATPYGTRTVSRLDGGRTASYAFSTRLATMPAGGIAVTATAEDGGATTVEREFPLHACG